VHPCVRLLCHCAESRREWRMKTMIVSQRLTKTNYDG
jgi:hypothetical protein